MSHILASFFVVKRCLRPAGPFAARQISIFRVAKVEWPASAEQTFDGCAVIFALGNLGKRGMICVGFMTTNDPEAGETFSRSEDEICFLSVNSQERASRKIG
ncbi:MAG: hypothetical protein K2Y01_02395 [Rhabdochlamydiaceae bacterium]|nr:hypothetical protein [Rhabdochlamydiaceae bacterium]